MNKELPASQPTPHLPPPEPWPEPEASEGGVPVNEPEFFIPCPPDPTEPPHAPEPVEIDHPWTNDWPLEREAPSYPAIHPPQPWPDAGDDDKPPPPHGPWRREGG